MAFRVALLATALALAATAVGAPLQAQTRVPPELASELDVLQQAREAEAAGDLERAERLLRELLRRNPGALSAMLSIERLLRIQGRLEEALPLLAGLLDHDPDSPIGHQLTVRTLSMLDRPDELARAQEEWIEAARDVETPYREAARIWLDRGDAARAIEVLRRGRDHLGPDALAYELGSAYAEAGDAAAAAGEWQRTIGPDADRFTLVQRRLGTLSDGGASIIPRLIVALKTPPTTTPRVRAALALAVRAGLAAEALDLARAVEARLPAAERPSFLLEIAREADAQRETRLAYWAYRSLLGAGNPEGIEPVALRRRLAELALAVGDTTTAKTAYAELMEQADAGSAARRSAEAAAIELGVRDADLDGAAARLEAFLSRYPEAPEADALIAAVARELLDAGREQEATRLLQGMDGPHSSLIRARLALAGAQPAAAREALLAAASGLTGAEATDAIALATLLGRVSAAGASRIAEANAAIRRGDVDEGLERLIAPSAGLRADERAALLEYGYRIAEREGLSVRAEAIQRVLVDEYPHAQETAGALLGLARALAERDDAQQARTLLERLIVEHPRSALVPQARRLLAEITHGTPES